MNIQSPALYSPHPKSCISWLMYSVPFMYYKWGRLGWGQWVGQEPMTRPLWRSAHIPEAQHLAHQRMLSSVLCHVIQRALGGCPGLMSEWGLHDTVAVNLQRSFSGPLHRIRSVLFANFNKCKTLPPFEYFLFNSCSGQEPGLSRRSPPCARSQ